MHLDFYRKLLKSVVFLCFVFYGIGLSSHAVSQTLQLDVATIMRDPKWIGSFPNRPFWSEDGKWIYFYWNPENADSDSLYRMSLKSLRAEKVPLPEIQNIPPAGGVYSRDYRYKLFERDGDIFLYDVKRKRLQQITRTAERESNPTFSLDESAVIFQRGWNLFRWDRKSGQITQLVEFKKGKKPDPEPKPKTEQEKFLRQEELSLFQVLKKRKERRDRRRKAREQIKSGPSTIYVGKASVQIPRLSPDGKYITLRLFERNPNAKRTLVPNYVTESGFTETIPARTKVGAPQGTSKFAFVDLERDTLIIIKPDSLPGIFEVPPYTVPPKKQNAKKKKSPDKPKPRPVTFHGPYWSPDGRRAFVVVTSDDNKDRWLALLHLPSGQLEPFEHQHDEAWIGGPNIIGWGRPGRVGWMPDNRRIWFCSEETGYSHLYVYDVITRKKTALTQGEFEIYNPFLSRNKKYWYFHANKEHPGERHFYRMPANGGNMVKLTSLPGRNDVVLSPDEKNLLIRRSFSNQPPELYLQKNAPGARARQLTESTTEEWRSYRWRIPEIVRIPARDGAKPYARLYRPEKPNGAAVIFVHGAGYLQNAHKWWSSYFREYMFHNLLADRGYYVLDIDYRGSAGYGRDWRTAIYRHMGGKDLDDQIDGARWLVKEFGVDPKRIGIYGGSYGGFITLMAMFTQPDVFACGAALRPVTDWAHYNHPYTSNILNIPQADTLAFRRSSPIYHAEGLKGRLLICHGMIDTNVHFQDVVRLVQRLIELGKENWELAVYPLEGHGFREPSSWTDEYRRILKLFEETLR